jgi:small-conductance mechanosensitive channel
VTNWTANDQQVRISLPVGVSYDSDPQLVREILLAVTSGNDGILANPRPDVIFTEFGDNSLDFQLRVWTIQHVHSPAKPKSDLYFAIFEAFKKDGIELPFPPRDLHVRSIPESLSAGLVSSAGKTA